MIETHLGSRRPSPRHEYLAHPRPSLEAALMPSGVYRMVKRYGKQVEISVDRFGPHPARATAATNASDQGANIATTAPNTAIELPAEKARRASAGAARETCSIGWATRTSAGNKLLNAIVMYVTS
jgi:hypothetical protein